jgi:hypothetical protein
MERLIMYETDRQRPDVSAEEQAASELCKRIRKLKWIGMDEEAREMRILLRRVELGDSFLAGPPDAD